MNIIVRRAGRRDLEKLHALWRALRELEGKVDPRLELSKDGAEVTRHHREVILSDPRTGLFVAERGAELVGYLHMQIESGDPIYDPARYGRVVDLFVREDLRRQGIGSRLLAYGREWLASHGLAVYQVTIPVQLPDGQRFFERQGAQPLWVIQHAELPTRSGRPSASVADAGSDEA
ncbi:MAG: GNAT family N-acetyltransferase [Myxococcota bacterium]